MKSTPGRQTEADLWQPCEDKISVVKTCQHEQMDEGCCGTKQQTAPYNLHPTQAIVVGPTEGVHTISHG